MSKYPFSVQITFLDLDVKLNVGDGGERKRENLS